MTLECVCVCSQCSLTTELEQQSCDLRVVVVHGVV